MIGFSYRFLTPDITPQHSFEEQEEKNDVSNIADKLLCSTSAAVNTPCITFLSASFIVEESWSKSFSSISIENQRSGLAILPAMELINSVTYEH